MFLTQILSLTLPSLHLHTVPQAFGLPLMTSMMQICPEIHQLERSFLDLHVFRSNSLGTGEHQGPVLLSGVVMTECTEERV